MLVLSGQTKSLDANFGSKLDFGLNLLPSLNKSNVCNLYVKQNKRNIIILYQSLILLKSDLNRSFTLFRINDRGALAAQRHSLFKMIKRH